MDFGERLRLLRTRAGMTQEALARLLYVSNTTVVRWESQSRAPRNLATVRELARVFDVDPDWLRYGQEKAADGEGGVESAATSLARGIAPYMPGLALEQIVEALERVMRMDPEMQRALFTVVRSMSNQGDNHNSDRQKVRDQA